MMLTDLGAAFDAAGVPWVGVGASPYDPTGAGDWSTRGRPASTGDFRPMGVLCHHTAPPAGTTPQTDLNVILAGNGDAPGPISQLYIGRDAVLYVVAAGRANHGGKGKRPGLDSSCADMNLHTLGIEVGNDGMGEHWSDAVVTTYGRTVAALSAWYQWPLDAVYLHATTGPPSGGCNSKIDPAGPWREQPDLPGGGAGTWDLDTWRAWCASFLSPTTPTPPEPAPTPSGDNVFVNKGTFATFMVAGGTATWLADPGDADALGVPPPDPSGRRGVTCSDSFFAGLVLIGPAPSEAGWSPDHFAAWWPDGVPPV